MGGSALTVTKVSQNSRGPAHVPPSVMHTLLLALSSLLSACLGDLQGLYTTLPGDGQLQLVNWTSGLSSPVGAGLAAAGLAVPACAPGLIQQTDKWYLTLAKNTTSADARLPWNLVTVGLFDGAVLSVTPLPAAFPPSLHACAHALSVDGGNVFYITGVVGDRLLTAKVNRTRTALVLNESVAAQGLGGAVAAPSATMLQQGDLWFQLAGGLVAFNVDSGARVGRLPLPAGGAALGGLGNAFSGTIYGLLRREASERREAL